MITGKIDVKKIDKKRLYVGKSGTYLDFVLIETPENKYGNDYMIVESITKEEREQGIKGRIMGSAKILNKKEPTTVQEAPQGTMAEPADDSDGLPF